MAIFNTQYYRKASSSFKLWSPKMTSNTTPTPYVVNASGQYNGGSSGPGDPWRAFDNSVVLGSRWYVIETNPWIQFDFGEQVQVFGIGIELDSENKSYGPRLFDVLGSNDGESWETIIGGLSTRSTTDLQAFMFPGSRLFRYYKLNIKNSNPCLIAEIKFYVSVAYANEHQQS